MKPLQRIWSSGLRRMTDKISGLVSFANTTSILNDMLHRDDDKMFASRTIADTVGQDGEDKEQNDIHFTSRIFEETAWLDKEGKVIPSMEIPPSITSPEYSEQGRKLIENLRDEVIASYNSRRVSEEQIKDKKLIDLIHCCPADSVFVMIDSIVIPFQKEHRDVNGVTGTKRDKKSTSIANAYILTIEGTYCFTAGTEREVTQRVLAYLVSNNMLANRELVFLVDGAKGIKSLVKEYFGFRPYSYFLDWYHLRKKCYELFSMALYGGKTNKERNTTIRYEFFKRLWAGNVDDALSYLDGLDKSYIKSPTFFNAIKEYIGESKREHIYSYALRKELGLVNSSNRCEKLNDVIVGERCKDNSISWSDEGSLHIAQIKIIFHNQEDTDGKWFLDHEAKYHPVPLSSEMMKHMYAA